MSRLVEVVDHLSKGVIDGENGQASGNSDEREGAGRAGGFGDQARLVKELRLKGICDIAQANELLTGGFDDDLNRRFASKRANPANYHRSGCTLRRRFNVWG